MKAAREIFVEVGLPLYMVGSPVASSGVRGFHEKTIKAIQDEAFKAGIESASEHIVIDGSKESLDKLATIQTVAFAAGKAAKAREIREALYVPQIP